MAHVIFFVMVVCCESKFTIAAIFHYQDCVLCGYHIPKGSYVLGNLYAAHMDPLVWDSPHTFQPERFLSTHPASEERTVKPSTAFLPYSIGKLLYNGVLLSYKAAGAEKILFGVFSTSVANYVLLCTIKVNLHHMCAHIEYALPLSRLFENGV